ncbi:MAG: M15 family metallopeptidase [Bacillaceae bacterium]
MDSLLTPIPTKGEAKTNSCLTKECGEVLVRIDREHSRIFLEPCYFQLGYPHALNAIYVRESVWIRLKEIIQRLPKEYGLLLYDGYRPLTVQAHLFKVVFNEIQKMNPTYSTHKVEAMTKQYVAVPSENAEKPSPHLTGGAIDLTLCDNNGTAIDMGTAFDSIQKESATVYYERQGMNEEIRMRRRILYNSMKLSGFVNYQEEWWHYEFGSQAWAKEMGAPYAIYGVGKL